MVYVTDIAMVDVSATTIRETVREGSAELLKALVSAPVADYIEKYRLYKNSNEN
jgi:nicotinic acid mononucleotide adenylyltransferase